MIWHQPTIQKVLKAGWREMELFVFRGQQTRLILICTEYYEMCYQALRTASKDKRRVKEDYTPGMERISSGRMQKIGCNNAKTMC